MISKEKLEELLLKKYSSYAIAKELGYSQTNIRYWVSKYRLKFTYIPTCYIQSTESGKILRKCPKCERELEINKSNFYISKKGKVHAWCKECNNKITSEKQKEIKRKAVEYKGGECCICGYKKYVGSLDFHHLNPSEKDFTISELRTYNWNKVQKELDKCILVCRNCHGELHGKVVAAPGLSPGTSPL